MSDEKLPPPAADDAALARGEPVDPSALGAGERRLRALLENLSENITVMDAEGRVLFSTRTLMPSLGLAPQTVIGRSPLDLVHPEDLAAAEQAFRDVSTRDGATAHVRLRVAASSGEWRTLECTAVNRLALPDIGGIVVTARDITRRAEAEEQLRVQREMLQQILDKLPLMLSMLDADGRFTWVNRAWRNTSGWTLEDARDPGFAEKAVVDAGAREAIPGRLTDAAGEWYDVRIRTRSGQVLTVNWSDVRLPDGSFLGIGRDVTEGRRSSQRLRESEERYRLMIERSDQVFFYIHDVDGVFEYVSPSTAAVLGYAPGELIGNRYSMLTPPDRTAEVDEKTRQALDSGVGIAPYEVVCRHKLGHLVRMEVTESPIVRDGRVVGMQGFARDVTQLRRLEEQVQQGQKMEAVGRLAGGVAHDFNNILTVIDGNADIGLLEPAIPRGVQDALSEIKLASERGARLTRQLLAFSRKQVVQRTVIDLNACVRNMHAMLNRLIGEHVMLRLETSTEPCWTLADAGQLEQVLLNLAVNARDAMPRGGELRIRTRRASPGEGGKGAAGAWVVLEVEDQGEGIDPEVLPHIFEPFFTTRDRGKGTGLGLATSYAIAEANGGWIEVTSRPGQGARFRVFLPLSETGQAAEATPPETGVVGGGEAILLAEDDAAVRGVVRHTLRRLGYTLHEAEHGAHALEVLRSAPDIRLLVSDVLMPVMGGIELSERVRALHPDLPVLFISGYADDASGIRTGNAPLLHKPFTARELASAIRTLLDGARPEAG